MKLLKLIINDLKKNFKIFSFFLIFFSLTFYIAAHSYKVNKFNYFSNIILAYPESKVKWVDFDKLKFSEGLFFVFAEDDIESTVKKICNIKNLKLTSDFNKKIEGFSFIEIRFYHTEKAAEDCINKIFNEIIIKHFNEYLDKLSLVNNSYLNLLETEQMSNNYEFLEDIDQYLSSKNLDTMTNEIQKSLLLKYFEQNRENERIAFMMKVSSLKSSYNKPRIYESNVNSIYKETSINLVKIITSSLIFASILTLLVGSLFNRIRQKI